MNEATTTQTTELIYRRFSDPVNLFGMELPPWVWGVVLGVVLAVAFFYVGWMYRKDSRSVGPWWASFLGLLRSTVYFLLAWIFLLPALQTWEKSETHSKVVILLDVSGSMHRSLMELASTARASLRPLGVRDRVAVMLFARQSAVRQPFTADFGLVESEIAGAVKAQDLGSGTAINSAILSAADYIGRQLATARRAVLIATDNLSLNYRVPDEEVIRALYAADATLDAILIGNPRRLLTFV